MISRLHQKLGTAGFAIACVALIAALAGTAFAATGLNSKQKKEVKKIAKQFAGKDGKNGKDGAPGPAGPAGAAGKDGANGSNGQDGADGAPGANGKNVVTVSFTGGTEPTGNPCNENGGVSVEVEGSGDKEIVCNGEEGAEGSPWPGGGTLPPGETETGAWAVGPLPEGGPSEVDTALSFFLPLSSPLTYTGSCAVAAPDQPGTCQVHYINAAGLEMANEEGVASTYCLGDAAEPTAAPGHLCVYAEVESNVIGFNETIGQAAGNSPGASTAGAVLTLYPLGSFGRAKGTYAVTASTP